MHRLISNGTHDLTGGESSIFPPGSMESKYSLLAQNIYVGKDQKLCKLLGYKPIHENQIGLGLTSGVDFLYGSIKRTIVAGGGRIYKLADNHLVQYESVLGNATKRIYFAQLGNKLVAVNGADIVLSMEADADIWTEDDWTLLEDFKPTKPFVFKNRVWYINENNKMEAMHSALQDATTIEGYIDFSGVLPQADELIDIKGYLDFICFIFKNHVLVYSGNTPSGQVSDFSLYQVISLPGILSAETNLNVNNQLFLSTRTGIKNFKMQYPSTKITINEFTAIDDINIMQMIKDNPDTTYYASGYYGDSDLYFFVYGTKGIVYSARYNAFSQIVFPDPVSWWAGVFSDVEGNLNILAGGYLHRYGNDFRFNGQDQLVIWKSGWLPLHPYGATCFPKYADIFVKAAKRGGQLSVNAQIYDGEMVSADYAVGYYDVEYDTGIISSKMDSERFYEWDEDFYMDSYTPTPLRVPLMNCGKYITITIAEKEPVNGLEFSGMKVFSDRRNK